MDIGDMLSSGVRATQSLAETPAHSIFKISPAQVLVNLRCDVLAFSLFVLAIFTIVSSDGDTAVSFAVHQLTDSLNLEWYPSVYNGTIAWMGHDGKDDEIKFV